LNKLFPRYAGKTLDDFQVTDPSHEVALREVKTYMGAVREARAAGHGLTFLGQAGVGKTYLAEMVLKYAQEEGFSIESIAAATYIDLHYDQMVYSKHDEDEEYRTHQHIQRIQSQTDFVLFDDVGREHSGQSEWSNHILFNALRFRSDRCLPFLVTSNLTPTALNERYTEGFLSLLREVTTVLIIEGEDFRCRKDS